MLKSKRTIKKIIVSALIALVISVNATALVGFFADAQVDSHETTAFAADSAAELTPEEKAIADTAAAEAAAATELEENATPNATVNPEELKDMEGKIKFIVQIQKPTCAPNFFLRINVV